MIPRPAPGVPSASWVYRFAAAIAFLVMRVQRWRFDLAGLDRVPRTGGAVLVANHSSFWDFFLVGRGPYVHHGRPVRILAKASLFDTPVFGWLMRRAEHIPVHRGSGQAAYASAVEALRRGELVLVLPEQTITPSFELLPFKTGAVRMARAAGVPIVPAASWGSHRFHTVQQPIRWSWRLPVSIRYGDPIDVAADEDVVAATDRVRRAVDGLLDQAITEYPDGSPAGAWWVPAARGGGAPTPEQADDYLASVRTRWQRATERVRRRSS